MNSGFVYYNFVCFVMLQFFGFQYNAATKGGFKTRTGPYLTTSVRTEKCKSAQRPIMKKSIAVFYAELYNTTNAINLVKGNVSVLRDNKNLMVDYKGYLWENGKWQMCFVAKNINCRTPVVSLILPSMGIKINKKTCSAPKGHYKFENINYNKIDHIWAQSREYGRVLWKMEVHNQREAVLCWETETIVTPA